MVAMGLQLNCRDSVETIAASGNRSANSAMLRLPVKSNEVVVKAGAREVKISAKKSKQSYSETNLKIPSSAQI